MTSLQQRWNRLFVLPRVALIVVSLCAGCGDQGIKLYKVTGTVTVDGEPLSSAGVAFHPDATQGNQLDLLPAATTDADGKYELITTARKGAPLGWYKVVVVPYRPAPGRGQPRAGKRPPFHTRYSNVETSNLQIEVTASPAPNAYDLHLSK
jgi:hypothetical protein